MKTAYLSMKHITRHKGGYVVRKTMNGKTWRAFFGFKAYNGVLFAFSAAQAYRNELLKGLQQRFSVKTRHPKNKTGVIGITWHCQPHGSRPNSITHTFRAQAPNKELKSPACTSLSVKMYGLWEAFNMAVSWRARRIGLYGSPSSPAEVEQAFIGFLDYYCSAMQGEQNSLVRQEMKRAIKALFDDEATPLNIKKVALERSDPINQAA